MNKGRVFVKQFAPALLIGALALFVFAVVAPAQRLNQLPPPPAAPIYKPKPTPTPKPTPEEPLDVVRVTSNLVMVPVSVVDQQGQAVHGLQVNDFRLDEAGQRQQITEIGDPEQVPLDIALLFDISSSVSDKGFFEFQQKAAASFLRQVLKPMDKAAVFTIAEEPKLVAPLASAANTAATLLTIPAATTPVPTAFYDTVSAAAKYLMTNSTTGRRRVILVITDGDDNFSRLVQDLSVAEARANIKGEVTPAASRVSLQARHKVAVQEVQRVVQLADATFYSVNPGGPSVRLNQIAMRAEAGMEAIASATGGNAFIPESDKALERVFNEVAAELRGQYLLQYYSNSQLPSGQFRGITVSIPGRGDTRVRARQGYYPKQQ
jgi:Ca-activated chloride channel family protein